MLTCLPIEFSFKDKLALDGYSSTKNGTAFRSKIYPYCKEYLRKLLPTERCSIKTYRMQKISSQFLITLKVSLELDVRFPHNFKQFRFLYFMLSTWLLQFLLPFFQSSTYISSLLTLFCFDYASNSSSCIIN